MLTVFTPWLQFWFTLAAVGLFGATIYLTRVKRLRTAGALAATLIVTGFNVLWDLVAHASGWWLYPSEARPILPLPIYFAQNLVWGGAFGLVGWRIQRRFGLGGLVVYISLLTALGALRDFTWASNTKAISFGTGPAPRLADLTCWASLLVIAQITIRLVAGPSTHDGLARTRDVSEK